MAGQIPDSLALTTWEEAFQHHPLPNIRKLSSHLRRQLADTQSTLRARVGARYPDLLAVADRIVDMDTHASDLHTQLGELGRRCDSRTLERGGANLARFLKAMREVEGGRDLAQTRVLMNTLRVADTMMKKKKMKKKAGATVNGDALTIAKLLVLARLLWKSVVEDRSSSPLRGQAVLEDLRKNLTGLRRRLMGLIERAMLVRTGGAGTDKEILSRALAAYALLTSSPPPHDLLRHFLHVRARQLDAAPSSPGGVREKLKIYVRTLSDVRALFPRAMAAQLTDLARGPILADAELAALVDFDGLRCWVSEEVGRFTPWTQAGGLGVEEVRRLLNGWEGEAQKSVVRAVQECVTALEEVKEVLGLRGDVVGRFAQLMGEEEGGEKGNYVGTVGEVRRACVNRLHSLVREAAGGGLRDILDSIEPQISSNPTMHNKNGALLPLSPSSDLWSLATTRTPQLDLSTPSLRQKILLSRRHGRDDALLSAYCTRLDSWTHNLLRLHALIRGMRTTKWDFDDEVEDTLRHELNVRDPDAVQAAFTHAVRESWKAIHGWVRSTADRVEDRGNTTRLLRILRETDGRWVGFVGEFGDGLEGPDMHVDGDTILVLHARLAEEVVREPLARYIMTATAARNGKVPVGLWDADGLPIQPSPEMFRFLVGLQTGMAEVGADLWGSGAVWALMEKVADDLPVPMKGDEETRDEQMTSRDHKSTSDEGQTRLEGEEMKEARSLQDLFDGMYIAHILSSRHQSASGRESSVTRLQQRMDELRTRVVRLDEPSHERLKKNVAEYWKRTYLLFGLLAGG
ncbi:hypothetical protein M433DRAFT_21399 [Acidomyces richmondensis BFW]|nr:MAG: hypothetical protein FE78DRAFT_34207 [Acidomyces sp. 'richmondensis']KYG49478.1 hypothetical protein M433DRAFT_21399 [Acidomyces richmondensis BFW]